MLNNSHSLSHQSEPSIECRCWAPTNHHSCSPPACTMLGGVGVPQQNWVHNTSEPCGLRAAHLTGNRNTRCSQPYFFHLTPSCTPLTVSSAHIFFFLSVSRISTYFPSCRSNACTTKEKKEFFFTHPCSSELIYLFISTGLFTCALWKSVSFYWNVKISESS